MKSVLIDTNLLVLYLVGDIDPTKIGHHRRLKNFDLDDFTKLNEVLTGFQRHVTLPNVLTETSNFIGAGKQEITRGAASNLAGYCRQTDEFYQNSCTIVGLPQYTRLGLTDAAIVEVGKRNITVLTDDHDLYGTLIGLKLSAINIYHFKNLF